MTRKRLRSRAAPKPHGIPKEHMPLQGLDRAIAQLGERLNGIQEVGGSIPPGSTIPQIPQIPTDPSSEGHGWSYGYVALGCARIFLGRPHHVHESESHACRGSSTGARRDRRIGGNPRDLQVREIHIILLPDGRADRRGHEGRIRRRHHRNGRGESGFCSERHGDTGTRR